MSSTVPTLVVAGTHSGCGKTTVAGGLMALLTGAGRRVQGIKAGPDYIDGGYHGLATGRPPRNLDTWMMSGATVIQSFGRATLDADTAIVEGVMGLYDGRFDGEEGSTAHLAKLIKAPVVLVVDCGGIGGSIAALVDGYRRFDDRVNLAGVFLNRVGSERHAALLRRAIYIKTGLPVVGYLKRELSLAVPKRHLGIHGVEDGAVGPDAWAEALEPNTDVDAVLELAAGAGPLPAVSPLEPGTAGRPVRIGVARDAAFRFYYQDNLELIELAGGRIVEFSPLADAEPPVVDGLYIGGGYPELFAARLAANGKMRSILREMIVAGTPAYAECGGLMYLSESLRSEAEHAMVGAVDGRSMMHAGRRSLGYVEAEPLDRTVVGAPGLKLRGHEFHWSTTEYAATRPAYRVSDGSGEMRLEGYAKDNILASYVHLHFGAHPEVAFNFIARCREGAGQWTAS